MKLKGGRDKKPPEVEYNYQPTSFRLPIEYKITIEENAINYIKGYAGKVVKNGRTERRLKRCLKLLQILGSEYKPPEILFKH